MIQKLSELTKESKIELIRSMAKGEINGNSVTPETFVATTGKDAFLGVMMAASPDGPNVVFVGEAEKVVSDIFENNRKIQN